MDSKSTHDRRLALLLWFRLARFYNQNIKASNKNLERWNLTTAQFDLLVQVGAHQPITQQALAKKLLVTKGNITHLVKKMEERGLVKRQQDWKTKYLSLSDIGVTIYKEVVPMQEQFQIEQFDTLDESEQKELLRLLNRLHKQEEK